MKFVLVDGPAALREGAIGDPIIVGINRAAILALDGVNRIGAIAGIIDLQILPGCAASAQEGKSELIGSSRGARGGTGGVDQINGFDVAVA